MNYYTLITCNIVRMKILVNLISYLIKLGNIGQFNQLIS